MINTWADLVIKYWQYDQLQTMMAPYKGKPPLTEFGSVAAPRSPPRRSACRT